MERQYDGDDMGWSHWERRDEVVGRVVSTVRELLRSADIVELDDGVVAVCGHLRSEELEKLLRDLELLEEQPSVPRR